MLLFIFTVTVVFIFSLSSCFLESNKTEEVEEIPDGIEVEIVIEEGMTLNQIADVLEENGIVDNGFMFRLFVQQKGKEKSLIPGTYNLLTGSKYDVVMEELSAGPVIITFNVTIPEGFTTINIVEKFSSELPFIEKEEMLDAVKVDNYNYDYIESKKRLEGYLFPKTYELTMDYDAYDIVEMMLAC